MAKEIIEMLIRQKFIEYKKELKDTFENDLNDLLDISQKCVNELAESGYIYRKVESFMFMNEFPENEINKFFAEECTGIDVGTLGPVEPEEVDVKIYEFIAKAKTETVKCKLWYELIDFLCRLKGENINKN